MDTTEQTRLFDALERAMWKWRDAVIVAPNGTMWLDAENPWSGDLRSFRDRMQGRVNRIRENLDGASEDVDEFQHALSDAVGLVVVIDGVLKGAT